jgi:hypothetical protein
MSLLLKELTVKSSRLKKFNKKTKLITKFIDLTIFQQQKRQIMLRNREFKTINLKIIR